MESQPEQPEKTEDEEVTDVVAETEVVIEDDDGEPITIEEARAAVMEVRQRARNAGLRPIRQMFTSYVNNALDAVDGLLDSLEGKKKGKG